jgi:AcrR family transcriptional regulator
MNVREQIIQNSAHLFFKTGFYKTTMDEIARNLKISKKTIYKHFATKDELLNAIIEDLMHYVSENVNNIISTDAQTVLKLSKLTNFLMSLMLKISDTWMSDIEMHNSKVWERIESFRRDTILYAFNKIIEQGKKEGEIVDKSNVIIMTIILSSVQGILNPDFLINNNISVEEAFKQTIDILISGILTEKGKITYEQIKKQGTL